MLNYLKQEIKKSFKNLFSMMKLKEEYLMI